MLMARNILVNMSINLSNYEDKFVGLFLYKILVFVVKILYYMYIYERDVRYYGR